MADLDAAFGISVRIMAETGAEGEEKECEGETGIAELMASGLKIV